MQSLFHGVREYLTPVLTESSFESKGLLTPEEFVKAGDLLVYKCPTWRWCVSAWSTVCGITSRGSMPTKCGGVSAGRAATRAAAARTSRTTSSTSSRAMVRGSRFIVCEVEVRI
jgi:hypothetical protein